MEQKHECPYHWPKMKTLKYKHIVMIMKCDNSVRLADWWPSTIAGLDWTGLDWTGKDHQ